MRAFQFSFGVMTG